MPYNNMYYPPYNSPPEYYTPEIIDEEQNDNENEIIEFPNNTRKESSSVLETILKKWNIKLDDLIILGILFFLYTEKCKDIYLYIALIMLFLDIDFENIISLL